MPAASTTARTAPPAMMPVPSGAGFSSTLPAPKLPTIAVRNRGALQRHADQVLLRRLDALLDRRRHFLRLADAEADHAVAVADDDQRAEAQVLAALDDLGHAVDRDDGVLDVELRRIDSSREFASLLLELQTCFARRVGDGANAAVIEEPAAVEHDALDALFDRALGDRLADRLGALRCCRRCTPLPNVPFTAGSTLDADTSVWPLRSSMTCA